MTALERTPYNTNFLQPDGFVISVRRLPKTVFFSQQVYIPGFVCQPTSAPTPFVKLPTPGDHLEFEDLVFTFKVDEDMKNFIEIYNWMSGIGYPDDFSQYKELSDAGLQNKDLGIYTDISVLITTNTKRPNIEFLFRNCFPISLQGFTLDTTITDPVEIMSQVTFKYDKYDVKLLNQN